MEQNNYASQRWVLHRKEKKKKTDHFVRAQDKIGFHVNSDQKKPNLEARISAKI